MKLMIQDQNSKLSKVHHLKSSIQFNSGVLSPEPQYKEKTLDLTIECPVQTTAAFVFCEMFFQAKREK